jgi:glutathione synthase/RimK-type ligase-like ATP-grasp enzyme
MIVLAKNGKESTKIIRLNTGIDTLKFLKNKSTGVILRKVLYNGIKTVNYNTPRITINWGNTIKDISAVVYNKKDAILKASNKKNCRLIWQESNNVRVPKTVATKEEALLLQFPIVVRPVSHFQGRDFTFINTKEELNSMQLNFPAYFSEFINKDKEYRVHLAHSKALLVQEKLKECGNAKDYKVWNHGLNGFKFKCLMQQDAPKKAIEYAINACRKIGLDFGAVDIMKKGDKYYVLEVNTSPSVDGLTAEKYGKYFKWLLNSNSYREHFNQTSIEKYFWSKEELDNNV